MKKFIFETQNPTQKQKDQVNLIKHVTSDTISTFIWHSIDDSIVSAIDTTQYVLVLQEHNVNCEYHLFDYGGHGIYLANEIYAKNEEEIMPEIAIWTNLAQKWMERQMYVGSQKDYKIIVKKCFT